MKRNIPEVPNEQLSVLQIKFENGEKIYLAAGSYMAVENPFYSTRYYPLSPEFPEREEGRKVDKNWMEGSYEAEIEFVPFLEACKEYENAILSPSKTPEQ